MVSCIRLSTIKLVGLTFTCLAGSLLIGSGAIAQNTPDELTAPLPEASDALDNGEAPTQPSPPPHPLHNDGDRRNPLPNEGDPQDSQQSETESPVQPPRVLPTPPPSFTAPVPFNSGLSDYLLGPGDQIGVAVIGFPEFENTRVVLPDGTLVLPLIDPVLAAGRTVSAVEADITDQLSFFLVDPVVELNLSVLRPVVVTVAGEVFRPGPIQLNSLTTINTRVGNDSQLNSASTAPTLSTALSSAGGVRRTADLRDIRVQRQLPNNRQQTIQVNLWESLFQGIQGEDILLQDGDVVFIPEATEDSDINEQIVARSTLAPALVRVRVVGEVERPGEIQISPDGSVAGAVGVAGGHTDDANLSQVALVRLNDNGQVEAQDIDLSNLVDATPIRDGDVVVVPKRGYLNVLDAISRTIQPITSPLNLFLLIERLFD